MVTTPEGKVVHWSKGAEIISGFTSGEAVGCSLDDLIAADRAQEKHRVLRETIRTGAVTWESIRKQKDGFEFPVELSLSPLQTEEGTLVMGAIRDITERKHIERVLNEKNRRTTVHLY